MNIGRLAEDNIRRFGEYDFVHFEGKWHSNAQMNRAANRLGNALKTLGIGKGDRVGVQLLNCPELIQAYFAIFKIGAVLVPVNPSLRAHELGYIYRDAGIAGLVSSVEYIDKVREARREAPGLKHIILAGDDIPGDMLPYSGISEVEADGLVTEDTDNHDLAVILYTAGTTGSPKGVMLTHNNWYTHVTGYYDLVLLDTWGVGLKRKVRAKSSVRGVAAWREEQVFGVSRNRVSLIALPLFHGYGIFAVSLEFLTGGRLVVLGRWDAEEAMRHIQQFGVTEFRSVPTMYIQLLNHPAAAEYDLSSLRVCICGSAPMPLEVARQWKERYGIDIWEGYGLSEATTVNCGNIAGHSPRYGSIGKCYQKCNTIKIFDGDDRELPPNRTGEIVIRGSGVMLGYWNRPEETAEALLNGWLHTGDIGHMDEDGYLYITERKKDLIIRGGENVYPKEVENVLHMHPMVLEAGVIGVPDPVYGEEVRAFVVLKVSGSADEKEIIDFCSQHLPAYKRPKSVFFMEALPRSAVGKVLRRELRSIG